MIEHEVASKKLVTKLFNSLAALQTMSFHDRELVSMVMIDELTRAGRAVEREVWEQAAQHLEDDCYASANATEDRIGPEKFAHNHNQNRLAKFFREQGA